MKTEEPDPAIIIHELLEALEWVAQWKDFYNDPIKALAWQKKVNPAIEAGKEYIRELRTH